MAASIPHRELRNRSGEILRQAEKGQMFTVTVDGRPVAVIGPYPRRQWVRKADVLDLLRSDRPDPQLAQDIKDLGGTLEGLSDPWER
jgi:prevent-host-death family protein